MSATDQIELFNTLFYVSLAVAIIGLGLAVFFFFFFDIRSVYALMTGKAKRQTIERMTEQNSRTGRLQQIPVSENIRGTGPSSHNLGSVTVNEETAQLSADAETSLLAEQLAETSVLGGQTSETSVLSSGGDTTVSEAERQAVSAEPPIPFDITENTMVIHTTDII